MRLLFVLMIALVMAAVGCQSDLPAAPTPTVKQEAATPSPPAPTQAPEPTPSPTAQPSRWRAIDAPRGAGTSGAQWVEIDSQEERKMRAAVFRPKGNGPFPVVVFLHGTMGFRQIHVDLARDLSQGGFLTVAACWFGGHFMATPELVTSPATYPDEIDCPSGPGIQDGQLPDPRHVLSLINAVRTLPDARADRVGLMGHSRGSNAAIVAASSGGARAVVAVAGYPRQGPRVPVLILQGTADQLIDSQRAKEYERALQAGGNPAESHYYEGAGHVALFETATRGDMLQRAIEFLRKYAGP